MRKKITSEDERVNTRLRITEDMSSTDILLAVMKDLKRQFDLSPRGACIECNDRMYFGALTPQETVNVILKLAEDRAITFEQDWHSLCDNSRIVSLTQDYQICKIRKATSFDEVYNRLVGIKNITENRKEMLRLSYTTDRKLVLNNLFLITEPRDGSINDRIIRFLINHPNETFFRQYFEKIELLKIEEKETKGGKIQEGENKNFYTILDDLNFSGNLRDVFFSRDLSPNSLHLKNPIYQEDLDKLGIKYIDIRKQLKR